MTRDETVTRRFVATILGVLGVVVLVDVAIIATVQPDASYDGFRTVMLVIVGALLVSGGAITFAWPKRGSVETVDEHDE
jgi:uncharacterized membrane protein YedE/YeeE